MNTQADISKAKSLILAELSRLSGGSRWPADGLPIADDYRIMPGGHVSHPSQTITGNINTRWAFNLFEFEALAATLCEAVKLGLRQTQHRIDSLEKKADRARRIIEILSEED